MAKKTLTTSYLVKLSNANHDGVTQQIDDRFSAFETDSLMLLQAAAEVHTARQAEDVAYKLDFRPLRGENKEAFLSICGLGYFESSINGKKTGDDVLSPAFTEFSKTDMYLTYDVTDKLTTGENVISAVQLLGKMGDEEPVDLTGMNVVVVGGGNVAMDASRTAVRLGARSVKVVYRRRKQDMTALANEISGAVAEGVELVTLMAPVEILTDGTGAACAVKVKPQIPGEYRGRGPTPATVIKAIEAGKTAAANIDEYLGFHTELPFDIDIPSARSKLRSACGRCNMTDRPAAERVGDFELIEYCMTDEQAHQECSRCLRCDHFGYGSFRGGRKTAW